MQPNDTVRKRALRRQNVERICEVCGTVFMAPASKVEQGFFRACGKTCRAFMMTKPATLVPCRQCGVLFEQSRQLKARGYGFYCSHECYVEYKRATALTTRDARFWAKVEKSEGCWTWTGRCTSRGYGFFTVTQTGTRGSHRAAWEIATGETLTENDIICHTCDNPPCVRNDDEGIYEVAGIVLRRRGHLFKGTGLNNVRDMWEKGRAVRADVSLTAKLSEAEVRDIRARYAAGGITMAKLADEFRVSLSTVSLIVRRETWTHVT